MKTHWSVWALFLAVLFGAAVPSAHAGNDELLALKAAKVLDGLGNAYEPGMVVIKGSKIVSVGTSIGIPENCLIVDFGKKVICPGFIDLNTNLGAAKDLHEPASALQADLCAVDLANQDHEDFKDALRNGITTVMVAPEPRNVISGRATMLKTWCPKKGGTCAKERAVSAKGPMVMTVGPSCFKGDRLPTSRMGAVELLRTTLAEAREDAAPNKATGKKKADSGDPMIRALVNNRLKGFFFADEGYDIKTGLDLVQEFGLSLAIVGGKRVDDVKDRFKGMKVPIVFGPFDYSTSERDLMAPGVAAEAGIPVAFASNSPKRSSALLRITAALAVSAGLDKDVALTGLTARAAEIAGVATRVGALAPGLDADLAVYSDHPLHLHARLEAVFVNGSKAFEACASCSRKSSACKDLSSCLQIRSSCLHNQGEKQ